MYNTVQQAKQIKVILLTRFQCRSLPDITKGTNINSTAFKNSSSLVLRATSLAVVIEHASILFRAGCQTETCVHVGLPPARGIFAIYVLPNPMDEISLRDTFAPLIKLMCYIYMI